MADRSDLMLRLTRTLAQLTPHEPLSQRLCTAFVQVSEADQGAMSLGVTLADRVLVCATAPTAARYEDAQDLVNQGPSLDAFRTGEPVLSLSPGDQVRRWPGLAEVIGDLPPGPVHAIPMRPLRTVMGVLTVHHGLEVSPARTVADLQFLSDAIGAAIVGDLPVAEEQSRLWTERDRVAQATGMVVAQLGLGPEDALAVLRAHAYAEASSVVDVSRRVVARDLVFSEPPPSAGGSS